MAGRIAEHNRPLSDLKKYSVPGGHVRSLNNPHNFSPEGNILSFVRMCATTKSSARRKMPVVGGIRAVHHGRGRGVDFVILSGSRT